MKGARSLGVVMLAALGAASPVGAQWGSVQGRTSDTKITQCIMSSQQGSQEVRLLKFGDDQRYYVHIVSSQISIADSARVTVPVTFATAGLGT